jgi:hypothetical protein
VGQLAGHLADQLADLQTDWAQIYSVEIHPSIQLAALQHLPENQASVAETLMASSFLALAAAALVAVVEKAFLAAAAAASMAAVEKASLAAAVAFALDTEKAR